MFKKLLTGLFLLITTATNAQFGLFASAAYIGTNGNNTFYNNTAPGLGQDIGSVPFDGADFGLFEQNAGTLRLVGAEIKTFKGGADNVCSGTLHYTVYPLGNRPVAPVYQDINLGFYSDCFAPACGSFFGAFDINAGGGCCSAGDQKWQNPGFGVAANIDLTTYPIGDYTLEIYYSYTGEDGGNDCATTKYDNNNNPAANYQARFTITPVMPVNFGRISVQNKQRYNIINWNTYTETNTSSFTIERSENGNHFISIGEVHAAGNSSVIRNYSFSDHSPLNGWNYYRIRMNEIDGKSQFSSIVTTKNEFEKPWYIISNPAKNDIRVGGTQLNDRLIVYNTYGAEMIAVFATNQISIIPVNRFAHGIYYVKIMNERSMVVLPVSVQ